MEQFYSEVSGVNLEMAGFIDLSALALLAGYQMNTRGITPMGVQVLGAILNKCVSTWSSNLHCVNGDFSEGYFPRP